mmetsp:Transcript_4480/g.7519  ORF Transcript_4480/g.7519 Transcript_4480/m.7519 type:complete len:111 (+) Transcript_4480:1273-1605(+)
MGEGCSSSSASGEKRERWAHGCGKWEEHSRLALCALREEMLRLAEDVGESQLCCCAMGALWVLCCPDSSEEWLGRNRSWLLGRLAKPCAECPCSVHSAMSKLLNDCDLEP